MIWIRSAPAVSRMLLSTVTGSLFACSGEDPVFSRTFFFTVASAEVSVSVSASASISVSASVCGGTLSVSSCRISVSVSTAVSVSCPVSASSSLSVSFTVSVSVSSSVSDSVTGSVPASAAYVFGVGTDIHSAAAKANVMTFVVVRFSIYIPPLMQVLVPVFFIRYIYV